MFKRGSDSICLLCQCGFRPRAAFRTASPVPRKLSTSGRNDNNDKKDRPPEKLAFTPAEVQHQLELFSAADVLRRVMLGPRAINRSRSINQRLSARYLENKSWAPTPPSKWAYEQTRTSNDSDGVSTDEVIELLRFQINACTCAEDVGRVITTALRGRDDEDARRRATLVTNPSLLETMRKKIYKWDPEPNLELLGRFISRLESHGQQVPVGLVYEALKAAALTQSFAAFRRYFQMWQDGSQADISERDSITKLVILLRQGFSLGSTSTFARRRQGMLELLFGPTDSRTAECNLSNRLPVENFRLLAPWLALLADCKAGDQIWQEWERTKKGNRWLPRDAEPTREIRFENHRTGIFILALCRAGNPRLAWQVFQSTEHLMDSTPPQEDISIPAAVTSAPLFHTWVWDALLAHPDSKPNLPPRLQHALDQILLTRLDGLLAPIEAQLSITWHKPSASTLGFHTPAPTPSAQDEELDEPPEDAATDAAAILVAFDGQIDDIFARRWNVSAHRASSPGLGVSVDSRPDRNVLDTLVSAVGRTRASPASASASASKSKPTSTAGWIRRPYSK